MMDTSSQQKGFTLMEVLISSTILIFGVVGGLALINFSLNSVQQVRNQAVASALMQEAFEVIRTMRDDNWHAVANSDPSDDVPWDEFINGVSAGCYNASGNRSDYTIDATQIQQAGYNPDAVIQCSSGGWDASTTLYRTSAGRFTHQASGNTPTPHQFQRRIVVFPQPAGCTPGVDCHFVHMHTFVRYSAGGNTQELQGIYRLYDWLRE